MVSVSTMKMIFFYLRDSFYDGEYFHIGNAKIKLGSSSYTVEVLDQKGGYQATYDYNSNDGYLSILEKLRNRNV